MNKTHLHLVLSLSLNNKTIIVNIAKNIYMDTYTTYLTDIRLKF